MKKKAYNLICFLFIAVWITVIVPRHVCASSIAEYNSYLQNAESTLQTAIREDRKHPGAGGGKLGGLVKNTPSSVKLKDGRNIDLKWLKQDIEKVRSIKDKSWQREANDLMGRIQSLRASRNVNGVSKTDIQPARAELADILKRNEYKQSFFDRFLIKILNALGKVFSGVFGSSVSEYIGLIIIGILILVFVVAVVYLVLHLTGYFTRRRVEGKSGAAISKTKQARPVYETLLERAEKEANEGHYRDAFRSIYLASIIMLDKARLIAYTDSDTNWEYMSAIRKQASPEAVRIFMEMTLLFDRLIYGHRDVSRDLYTQCRQHYSQLEALL